MNKWLDINLPIIGLSPMADLTDLPFSILVREVSKDLYKKLNIPPNILYDKNFFGPIIFREMVSANAVVMKNEKTLGMIELSDVEFPVVQQIVGNDPVVISEAAKIIIEKSNPFGIDINMGCPSKKINQNGSGAALLNTPDLASKIVKSVKKSVGDVPLSVKIRMGWSDPSGIIDFVKMLQDSGCDLISVHGRTRSQGYSGISDWSVIREIKNAVDIPVLGNGDIFDENSALEKLSVSNVDGVLIGRGALGNPWLFANIAFASLNQGSHSQNTLSLNDRIDVVLRHLDLHMKHYGPKGYITFKKHIVFYFKGIDLPNAKKLRTSLVTTNNDKEIREILRSLKV